MARISRPSKRRAGTSGSTKKTSNKNDQPQRRLLVTPPPPIASSRLSSPQLTQRRSFSWLGMPSASEMNAMAVELEKIVALKEKLLQQEREYNRILKERMQIKAGMFIEEPKEMEHEPTRTAGARFFAMNLYL